MTIIIHEDDAVPETTTIPLVSAAVAETEQQQQDDEVVRLVMVNTDDEQEQEDDHDEFPMNPAEEEDEEELDGSRGKRISHDGSISFVHNSKDVGTVATTVATSDETTTTAAASGPDAQVSSTAVEAPEDAGTTRIKFDKVIIREYARTVGDNPSCSSGPPVRYVFCFLVFAEISCCFAVGVDPDFAHGIFVQQLATLCFYYPHINILSFRVATTNHS